MGTHHGRQGDGCRVVVGPGEAAAARAAWPDAPIVALVEASEPTDAVLARSAGADVVVPTADLAAGWRDDTPGLALAVSAASSLAERRLGLRSSSRRSAHDLGQALSAINLATELALAADDKDDRLLDQIRTQVQDAGAHAWTAGRMGRASPGALVPVDLSSLLHRVATVEPDVVVYDSTGSVWVLAEESRLEQLLEDLVQHGRRSAARQRIDVRYAATAEVEITFRGAGKPRSPRPEAEREFGPMMLSEAANDMGGRLVEGPAGTRPVLRLTLPLLPDDGQETGRVKVPPDRMAIQTAILEGVLRHAPLPESLEAIVAAIEQQLPGTTCSVLLLDDQGCLNHSAGAGLPEAYRDEIDGVAIGHGQGSCGTAAFLGQAVIAADVETHPHWVDFKAVALAHGLRSCWSTPILAADGGAVLGTFAVYRSEVWEPDDAATRLVSRFTYLAAIAIGHHRLFNAVAESESRFRGAFEGATAGMALVGLDGTFLMVNPALRAMLGPDAVEPGESNVLDLVEATHRDSITGGWDELTAARDRTDERDREPIEVPIVSDHRPEPLWVSLRSSLVAADDDQRSYLYIEMRDVTASRRHAVERRAREAAEAASRAKSDLLALVSHELRTPLNAILGFAQIMQLIELDAAQRAESVENIMKAGRHLLELINELLDLSLIEAGQLSTSVEEFDAEDIVEDALQILRPLADSRQITLRRGLSEELTASGVAEMAEPTDRRAVLRADRQCVRQVLINLLGNAVKFTPTGGEVGVAISRPSDGSVRISVVDSGPGIPDESLGHLFQPFHRLAPDNRPEAEGTGLGLSVAARLVEEMRGRVGVHSKLGAGSCFWVDLPGFAGPDSSGHPKVPASFQSILSPVVEDASTTGVVLYVEDDPACVQVMTAALALRPGVTVLTATSAAEGIAAARSNRVDAILLDIGLPDGSGWELLQALRDRPETASIPVVVLTAGPGVVPADTTAPEVVLTKPLDVGECIETVDDLLATSSA